MRSTSWSGPANLGAALPSMWCKPNTQVGERNGRMPRWHRVRSKFSSTQPVRSIHTSCRSASCPSNLKSTPRSDSAKTAATWAFDTDSLTVLTVSLGPDACFTTRHVSVMFHFVPGQVLESDSSFNFDSINKLRCCTHTVAAWSLHNLRIREMTALRIGCRQSAESTRMIQ